MLELIGNLWGFMLAALVLSAIAGWYFSEMRAKPRWRILEDERRYLRAEILGLAGERAPVSEQANARRRIADLEQALAEARGRGAEVEVLRLRISELERAGAAQPRSVAAIDVTDYTAKIASLEADLSAARAHIASGAPPVPVSLEADRNRIFTLEQELEEAQAKAAAAEDLEARLKQLEAAPPPAPDDEATLLQWRNRYLSERVKYLEAQTPAEEIVAPMPAPAPVQAVAAPVDPEQEDRVRWRMRYLEQRALYLSEQLAAAPAPAPAAPVEDTAPLKARIAELEQGVAQGLAASAAQTAAADDAKKQLAAAEQVYANHVNGLEGRLAEAEKRAQANADLEHDAIRARWKSRYLEARVRYLEGRALAPAPVPEPAPKPTPQPVAAAPKPAPAPAPKPAAPVSDVFRMERPMALSAPRGGAPDDLRLITGVTGQAQSSLNAIGIFHFEQIAGWTAAHIAWVDQYLNLRGRIGAERWVEKAGRLARGESAVLEDETL